MEKIYFTLEEANALLPYLRERLEYLQAVKQDIMRLVDRMENERIDVELILSGKPIPEEQQPYRQKFEELGDQVNDALFDIQEKGVLVKDIEEGLVDFYARIKEEDVFLCWKLGEDEIQFWHKIQEGYDDRQSLFERDILQEVTQLH